MTSLVECGNPNCESKSSEVDSICGYLSSTDEYVCDYINYLVPREIYSLALIFEPPALPKAVEEMLNEEEEIYMILDDSRSLAEVSEALNSDGNAAYGEAVVTFIFQMISTWSATFGTRLDLNPSLESVEGPRFRVMSLNYEDGEIQIVLVLSFFLTSHQNDMPGWFPQSLSESIMDEDDAAWEMNGEVLALLKVEPE